MADLNKACILGRVGKDPEIRSVGNNGDRVANLSIATGEKWKDKQTGETKERTEWHRVTIWGPLVGVVESYVKKGTQLYIEGRIETRDYTDSAGVKKYTTEIVLRGFDSKLILLGGGAVKSDAKPADEPGSYEPGVDDEIPF